MNKRARTNKISISENILRVIILLLSFIILLFLWKNRSLLDDFESLGYIGLFLVNVISNATVFLPLPSIASVFVGGSIWNPLAVGFVTGIGSAVGELVGFFIGYGGRGIIDEIDGKYFGSLIRIEKWFKNSGLFTIFVLSVIPNPFFDLVGIVAGTLNYPLWKFFIATILGKLIRNYIIAWSGAKIIP